MADEFAVDSHTGIEYAEGYIHLSSLDYCVVCFAPLETSAEVCPSCVTHVYRDTADVLLSWGANANHELSWLARNNQ